LCVCELSTLTLKLIFFVSDKNKNNNNNNKNNKNLLTIFIIMTSVLRGTTHTHTGNKGSKTIVRYFPVSRPYQQDKNKPDIRFRGRNGRLLRLLVYKNKSFVGQLRAHVIIMDISMWSNEQLLAFNILYPNSLDSLSNKEKKNMLSSIEPWNAPRLFENECGKWTHEEQHVSDVLEVRATQKKHMTKHNQQTTSDVEIQMGGWSKAEKRLITHTQVNTVTSQLIELKAKSEKENRKQTLLDEQENITSTIIQLEEQIMKCKEKEKKVKTELKKIEKKEKKEKNEKRKREIQTALSKLVDELKTIEEEELEEIEEELEEIEEELEEIEEELEEIEEEEVEEEEVEEVEEEETPEFPGEEAIEEFEHDDLEKYTVDFYVDDNGNVWDENMSFVGKFNDEEDTLNILEGYEPLDEEEGDMSPLIQNFNFQRELEEDEKAQHFSTEEELEESKHDEGSKYWGLVDGTWRSMYRKM